MVIGCLVALLPVKICLQHSPVMTVNDFTVEKLQILLDLELCSHLVGCLSLSFCKAALTSRQDQDDDDDDSEPILGAWYEEVLNQNSNAAQDNDYMLLATRSVQFLDTQLVSGPNMEAYFRSKLTTADMVTLSYIIKNLDSNTAVLNGHFATAIRRFVHNLFAKNVLSVDLQNELLSRLGELNFLKSRCFVPSILIAAEIRHGRRLLACIRSERSLFLRTPPENGY